MTHQGVFLHRRGSPWRWPAATALALALVLTGILGTPRSWIDSFLAPHGPGHRFDREPPRPWLVLMPPPEIVVRSVPPGRAPVVPLELPEPPPVAAWWRAGWRIRVAATPLRSPRPTPVDSAHFLLQSLGLDRELAVRTRPDSLLAIRLLLLQREDAYRFDELKPYFEAMTRARAYADIQSRAADMYDDFLAGEIMVPD